MQVESPNRKVTVAGLSGAVSTVVLWLVGLALNDQVPFAVQGAITTIVVFSVPYMVPER